MSVAYHLFDQCVSGKLSFFSTFQLTLLSNVTVHARLDNKALVKHPLQLGAFYYIAVGVLPSRTTQSLLIPPSPQYSEFLERQGGF